MKEKNKKTEDITLIALREDKVIINKDFAFLEIGITDNDNLFIRLINKEKIFYESLFSLGL